MSPELIAAFAGMTRSKNETRRSTTHTFDRISFTRPTSPVSRRTLIPWGCVADFVKTSFTIPLVRVPLRWSCFCTIRTSEPGRILFLSMALILSFPRNTSRFGGRSSLLVLSSQEQGFQCKLPTALKSPEPNLDLLDSERFSLSKSIVPSCIRAIGQVLNLSSGTSKRLSR